MPDIHDQISDHDITKRNSDVLFHSRKYWSRVTLTDCKCSRISEVFEIVIKKRSNRAVELFMESTQQFFLWFTVLSTKYISRSLFGKQSADH